MTSSIVLVIFVTSFATYLSRFLGVVSSEKIKETSKWFRWFNCEYFHSVRAHWPDFCLLLVVSGGRLAFLAGKLFENA